MSTADPEPPAEVAPGIFLIRVPVPFPGLDILNAYLLREPDGKGWSVVDAGYNNAAARELWERTVGALGLRWEELQQIVVTHSHPDHFGAAGWMQQRSGGGAPVRISAREWEIVRMVWLDRPANRDSEIAAHAHRCGVPAVLVEMLRNAPNANQEHSTRKGTMPFPERVEFLEGGSRIVLGGRDWDVLHAPGHSDGQLLFHAPADRILLAADQVLPDITPNIGLWPGIEPDPLGRYLQSLKELRPLEVELALPGHGAPSARFPQRIDELTAHHATRLAHMEGVVRERGTASVLEVAQASWNFPAMSPEGWALSLVEALSHLDRSVYDGRLRRETSSEWVWKYAPAG